MSFTVKYTGFCYRGAFNNSQDFLSVQVVGRARTATFGPMDQRLMPSPLKRQTKIAADDTLFVYFYLSKKIRLDVSCDTSA